MPIEIRELLIRATISQEDESRDPQQQLEGKKDNDIPVIEDLINECVEQVLQILKDRYGR
jgi:hypothetical protein